MSLGAPRYRPLSGRFITQGGVQVTCLVEDIMKPEVEIQTLIDQLTQQRGVILTSSYEFPGRYSRWTLGFKDPPLVLEGHDRKFEIKALNDRGKV